MRVRIQPVTSENFFCKKKLKGGGGGGGGGVHMPLLGLKVGPLLRKSLLGP